MTNEEIRIRRQVARELAEEMRGLIDMYDHDTELHPLYKSGAYSAMNHIATFMKDKLENVK